MTKASKTVAMILVPLSVVYLGYRSCDSRDDGYATTRRSSSSGGRHSSWFFGRSTGGGSSSSGHSISSGTSRGGFGSHGGSVGS
jgi:hypothetical protein